MSIYGRTLDLENGKFPLDPFCAALRENGRGRMTDQALSAAVESMSGVPLTVAEQTEITELKNTVTGSPASKLDRADTINDVFRLAEARVAGYGTVAGMRAMLGLPA